MRENNVTPFNVMEMKMDVIKNQNGVRTALNNVTRFRPVNLLQVFLHCLYRRTVLEYIIKALVLLKPCFSLIFSPVDYVLGIRYTSTYILSSFLGVFICVFHSYFSFALICLALIYLYLTHHLKRFVHSC